MVHNLLWQELGGFLIRQTVRIATLNIGNAGSLLRTIRQNDVPSSRFIKQWEMGLGVGMEGTTSGT